MSWQDFGASEIQDAAPVTQELLQKFVDRDDTARSHSAGGQWPEVSITRGATTKIGRVWIPYNAARAQVQCAAGSFGGAPDAPTMRIVFDDGTTTAATAFSSVVAYPALTSFTGMTIPSSMRNKMVDVKANYEDPGGSGSGKNRNDMTATGGGFGIAFN